MMKNEMPCEVIRDLFPSYIDDLTCDVTNTYIEEHLAKCDGCRRVLEAMREPSAGLPDMKEKQEIDFLKKTRKHMRNVICRSILASLAVLVLFFLMKQYFIGTDINAEYTICNVKVDGNVLYLSGKSADDQLGISDISFSEENSVVTVSFKGVRRSTFYSADFAEQYVAADKIDEVRLGSRIIWSGGKYISAIASDVYNSRHLYVGDITENIRTAEALNIPGMLGNFKNELQTKEEPFGWKLIMEKTFMPGEIMNAEEAMRSCAYAMLAVIDNLDRVTYEYTVGKEVRVLAVTSEDAAAFAGRNIKTAGADASSLQSLLEKAGLTDGKAGF